MDAGTPAAEVRGRGVEGVLSREAALEDLVFTQETLADADLTDLTGRNLVFHGCRFSGCNFHRAEFYNCRFENCLFLDCRFFGSYWQESALSCCKGDGTDLSKSRFKRSLLTEGSFRYVNFTGGVLENSSFSQSNLSGSVLATCRISKTTFDKLDLTGASLFQTSCRGLDLSTCVLDGLILSESCAELKGAVIAAHQAAVVARILGIRVLP